MTSEDLKTALFWLVSFPSMTALIGYGFGWLAEARLPGDPLAWAGVGAFVGSTPAMVVGAYTLSIVIASTITGGGR